MDMIPHVPIDGEQTKVLWRALTAIPIDFWKYAALAVVAAIAHGKLKWAYALLALLALLG